MSIRDPATRVDEAEILADVREGDEAAFAAVAEPYRRQLLVHRYRMIGSLDEAEDLVHETMLRAWRGRAGFEGRSSLRTWLYRIATNVTLTALGRRPRRVLVPDVPAEDATAPFARERRPDLGAALAREVDRLPGVERVEVVTGPYDLIAEGGSEDPRGQRLAISELEGVLRTAAAPVAGARHQEPAVT